MNKFLPEIRLRIDDATGAFTHIAPFDRGMSRISIEFAVDQDTKDRNSFTFMVYIREPQSNQATPATEYDVTGLLDVNKMFSPDYARGHSGNIKTNLENIALKEIGVSAADVSSSLDYTKTLIQPHRTNAQFLKYHKENLIGKNGEYGYKCFVKSYMMKTYFVFKSLLEMIRDHVSYKFMLNDTKYEDRYPIFEYGIYDNYKLYGAFGVKQQDYSYFNYTTGTFVHAIETATNYLSLSDFYLIDQNDLSDSNEMQATGRSNDFTSNFAGLIKSSYSNRLLNLTKLWITTQGLPNIQPGQTVELFFPQGATGDNLYSFQYSGYWLVERVVHNMGDVFLTKLLLTRNGVDTDKKSTLLRAPLKVGKMNLTR